MAERSSYAPGEFCWTDLATTGAADVSEYYRELFAWDPRPMAAGEHREYILCFLGRRDVAALYDSEQPPHWRSYVSVESADASAVRAAEAGATIVEEPSDVIDQGRLAVIRDPVGAELCLWEARAHPGAALVNEPGCLTWNDLMTADPETAMGFYARLFGWTFSGEPPYRVIRNGARSNGGIFTHEGPAAWVPYFATESLDDAISRAGGALRGPQEVPAGRFAVVRDPRGAVFCLFEGEFDG